MRNLEENLQKSELMKIIVFRLRMTNGSKNWRRERFKVFKAGPRFNRGLTVMMLELI